MPSRCVGVVLWEFWLLGFAPVEGLGAGKHGVTRIEEQLIRSPQLTRSYIFPVEPFRHIRVMVSMHWMAQVNWSMVTTQVALISALAVN